MMMAAEYHFAKGMIKQLAALAMVAMAVGLSYLQKLCLERETAYSLFRAFVQLTVIGFLLQFIFSRQSVVWIFLVYIFMVCIAGHTAGQQAKHVPNGKYIAGASIFARTSVTINWSHHEATSRRHQVTNQSGGDGTGSRCHP
ncbi:hypothetical protein NL676_018285 [Syzygium grande]|nr:hypothetical protein NL676_018285 [Syzygium grande]